MAVSTKVYSHFPESALKELIDLGTPDTIKVMLCTSSYTPSQDDHDFKDDVDNEVADGNYVAGGATMANPAITLTARVLKFDGDDVSWAASTITARYAVIYDDTPAGDGAKPLIAYVDFGENKISENGTFQITWNAAGILTITVAA